MARFTLPWQRREQFSDSISTIESWASWLSGSPDTLEAVTPYSVLGLSAVLRSVSVISTTIADLPLRTYERSGDERQVIPSVFDDPLPGLEGQTPFAWVETVLIHLLLWRNAYLFHEKVDSAGIVTRYRPLLPSVIQSVKLIDGKKVFKYQNDAGEINEVGTEQITHIPGPSLDGVTGHPLLWAARNIFSAAISGDKAAARTLSQGIRLAGLLTPSAEGEDIDPSEGAEIVKALAPQLVGADNAGKIAFINRRLKLEPWSPTNVESQWHETRTEILGEVGRLFGVPAHLLNDTEKQTSWGTGVAEQNLGLARYTLKGWSTRIEQGLSRRLPSEQFVEFDYKGLLQGTPAQEIELLLSQVKGGLLTKDEARKILNLPPLTKAQKAELAPPAPPANPTPTPPTPIRQERSA
jgi:HK97 family phage portal protein